MDIAYWNIHGLNEEKFEDDLFISSVCKYDIICFSETMVGGSPGNLPGFSSPFIVKPTKKRKRGRPSGGMLIYTKPIIRQGTSEIKQTHFSAWLKFDRNHFNFKKNIFLCFIYIKPYQNKELSELTFTTLENDIAFFSSQ